MSYLSRSGKPPPTPLPSQIQQAQQLKSNRIDLHEKNVDLAPFTTLSRIKISEIHQLTIPHLRDWIPDLETRVNKFERTKVGKLTDGIGYNQVLTDDEVVLLELARKQDGPITGLLRAGPRAEIVWKRGEVKAAIVTAGGLCPGLNSVVCELVKILYYNYGVDDIFGIRMGYRGFYDPAFLPYLRLTPENTFGISELGGTILGSSRGGFNADKILAACKEHGINQVYFIGGDGTHRAANALYLESRARKLKFSAVGIPKTIDNDVGLIDKSFGFDTAVQEAVSAIKSARVEACCTPNGIGVVKLMGRNSGFIAAHASLAARDVDLVLIPEVKFDLLGQSGILPHIQQSLERKGHCLIVLAEGAGEHICAKTDLGTDAGGNRILPDIGTVLKDEIKKFFKEKKIDVSLKFNDPAYMIRSVASNAADSVYCIILAQNAVHGAMAGFTGFTSAEVNNRTVYIPMEIIAKVSPVFLNPLGRTWERVISSTHQPHAPLSKL